MSVTAACTGEGGAVAPKLRVGKRTTRNTLTAVVVVVVVVKDGKDGVCM